MLLIICYKFFIMLLLSNATTLIFVYYIEKSKFMREVFEKINFYNDIIIYGHLHYYYGHWHYNVMKYISQITINFKYLVFLIDFFFSISIPRYKLALFYLFSFRIFQFIVRHFDRISFIFFLIIRYFRSSLSFELFYFSSIIII